MEVARELLGTVLLHRSGSGSASAGRIVETEAYLGSGDAAAHSARGLTERTRVIFGPPGHAYVYLIYGMHECLNMVAEAEGAAGCVLIRALEPLGGIAQMRRRRASARGIEDLANGPGKLTQAMAITRRHNGADLTQGPLTVHLPVPAQPLEIAVSTRIGITQACELPLRFYLAGNRFVSRSAVRPDSRAAGL